MKARTVRITVGRNDFIEVAVEIAQSLQSRGLVDYCDNCDELHAFGISKERLEEQVNLLIN
jgi:predicted Co/Zn/Cd cation transporter (cation efflux family)